MIYLPTREETAAFCVDAHIQKTLEEFVRKNKSDIKDGRIRGVSLDGAYFRISRDGSVNILTQKEYDELWQHQK